jgi:hypothetical protein
MYNYRRSYIDITLPLNPKKMTVELLSKYIIFSLHLLSSMESSFLYFFSASTNCICYHNVFRGLKKHLSRGFSLCVCVGQDFEHISYNLFSRPPPPLPHTHIDTHNYIACKLVWDPWPSKTQGPATVYV